MNEVLNLTANSFGSKGDKVNRKHNEETLRNYVLRVTKGQVTVSDIVSHTQVPANKLDRWLKEDNRLLPVVIDATIYRKERARVSDQTFVIAR